VERLSLARKNTIDVKFLRKIDSYVSDFKFEYTANQTILDPETITNLRYLFTEFRVNGPEQQDLITQMKIRLLEKCFYILLLYSYTNENYVIFLDVITRVEDLRIFKIKKI
jgi:hypothetical protein